MTLAHRLLAPLLAPLLALSFVLPAAADPIPLATLSDYLNGLTSAETTFTQVNADGSTATGKLYIERPGRMRFEYDRPDNNLVLASAGTVAVFDAKSNQPPEQYPLARTPLNLILAPHIDLGQADMVTGTREDGAATVVTAQDPKHPDYGTIQLVFTADPVALRQWVITDETGGQTTVNLGELKASASFPPGLFSIELAIERRSPHGDR
jgi:outer membrane lipoprotein-sorting protein